MWGSTFNILAICGSAGFAGVMLCIGVTLGTYWRSLPPAEFLEWFAANGKFNSNTIPLIVAPTLIGLIGSLVIGWQLPDRLLWGLSLGCIIIVMALTFAYFVPSNSAFASGQVPVEAVAEKLNQWINLHYLRIVFAFIAAAIGCMAIRT
ncbi:DUF1772 domain-containing protein [Yoonia sp. GPGPB17]|uniref:DUF1772 domain-containing protein n=1 Tax=Yoonia sp. GPGPB17 TaxID=3026147 RepID=UPI0030C596EE